MPSATIYLTNECNLRCKHCFVGHDQLRKRSGLETQDILSIIANFADSGINTITLLGGEVTTERGDLKEILEFCHSCGVRASINTNLVDLTALIPLLNIEALVNIVVSIDGMSSDTHDQIRGKGTFEKTMANLLVLLDHQRIRDKTLTIDITFVLNALNKDDAFSLPKFCKNNSINKLNFKTLQFNDRAATNKSALQLSDKELLDTCTAFYLLCLLEGEINLDMHIPPAFGYYLNKIATTPEYLWNFESCGGTQVYTYVDLYGNNLPCPAMSLEENPASTLRSRSDTLNAIVNPIENIHSQNLFLEFNNSVQKRQNNHDMFPCRICVFSDRCSPCTNQIIRGNEGGVVDICAAVFSSGDERLAGITKEVFGQG